VAPAADDENTLGIFDLDDHRPGTLRRLFEGDLPGQVDLSSLYAPLRAQHPLQNIEGAFVNVDHLCLLQRGHATEPINAVIRFDWSAIQAWLRGAGSAPAPLSSTPIDLGTLDGVPLCFTDGATLPDGAWVFCASAVSPASTSHSRYPTAAA